MATKKIKLRRGTAAELPILDLAEPGFTTDTKELYIGDGISNIRIGSGLSNSANRFYVGVKKSSTAVNSSTWFDMSGGAQTTGSWSGFNTNNISPFIIPFNSQLTKVDIVIKGASYNWLASPDNLYFSLHFYKLLYNGTSDIVSVKLMLNGLYSGTKFDNETHYSKIDSIALNSGTNLFTEGDLVGVMFTTDSDNDPGRVNSLNRPYLKLMFEEV